MKIQRMVPAKEKFGFSNPFSARSSKMVPDFCNPCK